MINLKYVWADRKKLWPYFKKNWRTLTPGKIKNYFQAKKNEENPEDYLQEQVTWRINQVYFKSPNCITSGACVHCGCETPGKFYEPAACDQGCYPAIMNKEQWQAQKNNPL